MKIAVINFSGNVGKSTIAANLLAPRMPGARVFSIESTNLDATSDGIVVERLAGKHYHKLLSEMFLEDQAVVDVGASNIGDFLKFMQQYKKSHEFFDFYVVPVVGERKQQADTVNTISALSEIGIPAKKIRLVFNKVDLEDEASLKEVFEPLFGVHGAYKTFTLKAGAVIYKNDAYELLKHSGTTLSALVADDTDFRQKARDTHDDQERGRYVSLAMTRMLAVSAQKNLDSVFETLFA
jgi:MinD-like ATPase involved in chromosome partitioning or flagellar assembly